MERGWLGQLVSSVAHTGAALGARGVACFLLFLEEASLLFVFRFLPMVRRSGVAQAAAQECTQAETEAGGSHTPRLCSRSYTAAMRPLYCERSASFTRVAAAWHGFWQVQLASHQL